MVTATKTPPKLNIHRRHNNPAMQTGIYTSIYLNAVGTAHAGDIVTVASIITNLYSSVISILGDITISYGGNTYAVTYDTSVSGDVDPYYTLYIGGHFTMPQSAVTVTARSYWWGDDGMWHADDVQSTIVNVQVTNQWTQLYQSYHTVQPQYTAGWEKLYSFNRSVGLSAPAWSKLQTTNVDVGVTPITWGQLDQLNLGVGLQVSSWTRLATLSQQILVQQTAGWMKLATTTHGVTPQQTAGWAKLATLDKDLTVGVNAGWVMIDQATQQIQLGTPQPDIPANFKLVKDYKSAFSKSYNGAAEKCVTHPFTVNLPEQLGAWYIADRTIQAFEDEFKKNGMNILELKLYADTSPTFYTDFIIEATYRLPQPPPNAAAFIQIAIPVLVAIVAICLAAIVVAIAGTIAIKSVTDFLYKAGGGTSTLFLIAVIGGIAVLGFGIYAYTKSKSSKSFSTPVSLPVPAS